MIKFKKFAFAAVVTVGAALSTAHALDTRYEFLDSGDGIAVATSAKSFGTPEPNSAPHVTAEPLNRAYTSYLSAHSVSIEAAQAAAAAWQELRLELEKLGLSE